MRLSLVHVYVLRNHGAMSRTVKISFTCLSCSAALPKWHGRCPTCGEWGTVAGSEVSPQQGRQPPGLEENPPIPITEVSTEKEARFSTGFKEVDRVLGGGLVSGSAVLVGGDPGIGKSTLMTMLGYRIAASGRRVLYVTGEESAAQVRLRADRLGALHHEYLLLSETGLDAVAAHMGNASPAVCILDSIQTLHCPDTSGGPGTVTQVREAAHHLVGLAKALGMALFIVGHVTKDGALAGPRTLEHLVDVVLSFDGDRFQSFRLLRGVKNRYGAAGEVAVLDMSVRGLEEVANPSELFLRGRTPEEPGSAVVPAIIGTRTFLVEIQALVMPATQGMPRRVTTGLDPRRSQLVQAILERRGGFSLAALDVYVNAVGGLQVEEPAADLPLALALASAASEIPVPGDLAAAGELGLIGEVRAVPRLDMRLAEAARLGFKRAVVPEASVGSIDVNQIKGMKIETLSRLDRALEVVGVA